MRKKNTKSAKNVGKSKRSSHADFDTGVLTDNPPIQPKKLPHRVYKRGTQGTFVYSPDIAIYVYTADHGIIDLGPHMTSWSLTRNVNNISSFSCSFDNKFSRYDRVIRRMDRIAVFLKRVEWVQVFAGYLTVTPWETIVPGDATLEAECTLKRIFHTFWDPNAAASWQLFPALNGAEAWKADDGGASWSLFNMLTTIVHWDSSQIKIQRIPEAWLQQAAIMIQKVQAAEYDDNESGAYLKIVQDLLEDIMNKAGYPGTPNPDYEGPITTSSDVHRNADGEKNWKKSRKSGRLSVGSDVISIGQTSSPRAPSSIRGEELYLRADAAASLNRIMGLGARTAMTGNIAAAYLSESQMTSLTGHGSEQGSGSTVTSSIVSLDRNEGWGTSIHLVDDGERWAADNPSIMLDNGWVLKATGHYKFVGNGETDDTGPGALGYGVKGWSSNSFRSSASGKDTSKERKTNTAQSEDTNSPAGNQSTTWLPAQLPNFTDPLSTGLTGERAWVNDVPISETILMLAAASNRDIQSAPNGDFISFFPDRTGANGKEPVVLIRDIEITDMNLEIHDSDLVTHYISVGNIDVTPVAGSIDLVNILRGGMVTIEMDELMRYLFGFEESDNAPSLGDWILGRFGIRPLREDAPMIRDAGWNYCLALHRFQTFWAQQWSTGVGFTFLPELFPGMRIELADHGMALYVESLTHSGSRNGLWTTNAVVSTPMHKVDGKWKMLRAEWPVGLLDSKETADNAQWTSQYNGDLRASTSNPNGVLLPGNPPIEPVDPAPAVGD